MISGPTVWGNQLRQIPTLRSALDAVSSAHPIALLGNDGHHGGFNSYAMSLATDREGNQVPLNKQSLRIAYSHLKALVGVDAEGEPNGVINEDARKVVGIPNLGLSRDRCNAS